MALRIITGSAGGLHLQTPKGVEIRPTQDRIKQAIFSSLGELVFDAQVLDLYAGTGALGLEALSRGASEATFVEVNKKCVDCIQKNLEHCRLTGRVIKSDATTFLKGASRPSFNLVFADPPYVKDQSRSSAESEVTLLRPWLHPQAIVVWEYFSGQELTTPNWTELLFNRSYGETGVVILRSLS
jgi:16S rRNA (guanine966-N2)-methyltransferase